MLLQTVSTLVHRLWSDDCGAVVSAEYLALGSVVVLGSVAGLASMRDAVNGELQEYGNSLRQIRQQYSVPGLRTRGASVPGSAAADRGGDTFGFVNRDGDRPAFPVCTGAECK